MSAFAQDAPEVAVADAHVFCADGSGYASWNARSDPEPLIAPNRFRNKAS